MIVPPGAPERQAASLAETEQGAPNALLFRLRDGCAFGLERIDLGRPCFAAMLGGRDRRTLFMLTADWRGTEGVEDVIKARTGQVLVVEAPAPGVGWP